MEGAGSRLSRASSRYGPTATVFNGPVRKWKKRWVHVSPPPPSATHTNHHKPHFRPNNPSSALFLCRWTPVSSGASAASDGDDGSGSAEETPRRKYRYTPIAALEDHTKTAARKADEGKISENYPSTGGPMVENDDIYGKIDHSDDEDKEVQNSSKGGLDLGVSLDETENGHDDDEDKSTTMLKTTASGFWSMG
ncbi:uncharacterized protein LOC115749979 [Rhodamnia argentea]|uniref:Uncharacterized protein LOC115749979 n=1 Tax=Rhodamnia argentea TaxID=178133 RepID=A0A8B8Q725_9MYRT|nr:uncharacterized protein LOC115749979 [Rhodamnia argentea]